MSPISICGYVENELLVTSYWLLVTGFLLLVACYPKIGFSKYKQPHR